MAVAPPSLAEALQGRYTIERELGRGGMATVYLARDLKHDRSVALKVLRPELAAVLGAERFLREIRLTAQLQHPHILTLIDSGEADGFLYYVMPYVEGESLRERLEREAQLPLDEALRITRGVASALDFAHGRGVIHRDIKPENIMLHQGEPMVADFGIALAVSTAGRERLTETGLSLGTPAYMSPEQASAEPKLDGRTDQYSLACVVYEMLAGEPPYTGPTAQAIIAKRLSEPIPHLSTVRQVPPAVEATITKALAKVPADRFPTAGEFVAALGQVPRRRLLSRRMAALLGAAAALGVVALLAFLARSGPGPAFMVQRQFTFTGKASWPAISPDGESVAYVSGGRSLLVQRFAGGDPVVLVPPARFLYIPRWTGDGTAIVFVMFRDSTELAATFIVPSGGGPARKVIDEDITPFDTGQDSTVVMRAPRESHRLELVNLQSREVIRSIALPDSVGEVSEVAWSPDRRLIALRDSRGTVWTTPADGGTVNRIADGGSVRWGSGSIAVYYLTGPAGAVELRRAWIDRRTGARRGEAIRVLPIPSAVDISLGRGDRLIYSQSSTSVQARALVFGGGLPRRVVEDRLLTEGTASVSGAAISGDGQWVAYSQSRGGNEDVYVTRFSGGQGRPVASSPAGEAQPSWAPDGSRLAFARDDPSGPVLMVTDVNGGIPQRVGSLPGPGKAYGPGGRGHWSADGRHLAYYSLDLRRVVLLDVERQTEWVLAIPDSVGTGYFGLVPSPNGSAVVASTLVRTGDWGEVWLAQRDGNRWRRLRGPFGESYPIAWRDDGWIYLHNHRALWTDAGWWRSELWRMRGSDGRPALYARLPDGCQQTDLSADANRAVCVSIRRESDLYLATNFTGEPH